MANPVAINSELCIGCGLCVNDCVGGHLYLENGNAACKESGCISCGHCFAICPQGAVTLPALDASACTEVTPMTEISSEILLNAMKSRRSIRQFSSKAVGEEVIDKIIEAGRYAPTGSNAQDLHFTILGSRQAELEEHCLKLFRSGSKALAPVLNRYLGRSFDDHFFFKGAPLVIVVSARSDVNAALASSYMELMAESLGLGVLYSGFFILCAKVSRKIRNILNIPKGRRPITCMVIGYPTVKYQRTVPRKAAKISRL